MTNKSITPADLNRDGAVPRIGEDQAFNGAPNFDLRAPGELVVVAEIAVGMIAPVIVTEQAESGRALATADFLPPATIVAPASPTGLASMRLPPWDQRGGLAPDGNPGSRQAAQIAATRAKAEGGWTADVLPAPEGYSWADVLAGRVSPPEEDLNRIADMWVTCPTADPREIPNGLGDGINDGPHEAR